MPIETQVVTQARMHPDAEWTTLGPGAVELDRLRETLADIRSELGKCDCDDTYVCLFCRASSALEGPS